MKNKALILTSVLFIGAIVNYLRIYSHGSLRAVEFMSILAIGLLGGVLITQIFNALKRK